jgi:hypothetical protein
MRAGDIDTMMLVVFGEEDPGRGASMTLRLVVAVVSVVAVVAALAVYGWLHGRVDWGPLPVDLRVTR